MPLQPQITPLNYTYNKEDSDVWVLNTSEIPVKAEIIQDVQLVHLAPGSVGGNHKHPRTEWFVGIGELVFVWLDEEGEVHQEQMNPDGKLLLITVPTHLPHAVVNVSKDKPGVLYEMADGKMEAVEKVAVWGS